MPPITYAQLTAPADLFDRAALMPRPARLLPTPGPNRRLWLDQMPATAQLHPQLPPTPAWTYEGTLPGPVVEVEAGTTVKVRHRNHLTGTMPYAHVVVDEALGGSMNDPGRVGAAGAGPDADEAAHVAELDAFTVVHLHGGPTSPDSDGWAENVIGNGETRLVEYEFPRETWPMDGHDGSHRTFRSGAAPTFWYHDHGMGVTRFNVYAGLAGMWLVRDPLETTLGLPTDRDREIPLVLMDRNLDTVDGTATGALSGRLLHKVQVGVREAFAPVNLVNGMAWPRCAVSRKVHRLRLVNGSNARTYRLHFHGLTRPDEATATPLPDECVQQIGTDGGLLGAAVGLPAGLVLAPGERADVLIDFGLVAQRGFTHVVVYNSAAAPFNGAPLGSPDDIATPDAEGFRTIPQVMRFDLRPGPAKPGLKGHPIAGMALDPAFVRLPDGHDALPHDHGHTYVALREEDVVLRDELGLPRRDASGAVLTQTMLFLHELAPSDDADARGCNLHDDLVDGVDATGALVKVPAGISVTVPELPGVCLVTVGKRFTDASMAMIPQGAWHLWKVINLSPDTHPFHVHLCQYQVLSRAALVPKNPALPGPVPYAVPKGATEWEFATRTPLPVEQNETGWKDTVRVNPGQRDDDDNVITAEVVTVGACFARHSGRFMYHCHILEHEDTEMMRPFTVLPPDLMNFMDGAGPPM